jgi:hypothetical protein
MPHPPSILVFALVLASCRTTETRRLNFSEPGGEVRVASLERTWEIRAGDDVVGELVFFESHGPMQDSVFVVRNRWHQDLGMIDALGRAYRYMPHQREPAWVGTGTIAQGAEDILDVGVPCRLVELLLPEPGPRALEETVDEDAAPQREGPNTTPEASVPPQRLPTVPDRGFAQSR